MPTASDIENTDSSSNVCYIDNTQRDSEVEKKKPFFLEQSPFKEQSFDFHGQGASIENLYEADFNNLTLRSQKKYFSTMQHLYGYWRTVQTPNLHLSPQPSLTT